MWTLNLIRMKSICGYIFSGMIILSLCQPLAAQDTLRTYGPRIGIDLTRFAYLFSHPSQIGTELSVDAELADNLYPVIELGYNQMTENRDLFDYSSRGTYARAGLDYDFSPPKNRSEHHSITVGFRYGISFFTQSARDILIPGDYWGNYLLPSYEKRLTGHWVELVGGVKTEIVSNFFLGWSVRYKILLNPDMDPLMAPQLVPGYGNASEDRGFGFSYSILYKIPLFKR